MAVELAVAYVSILPEMSRVAPAVRKELGATEGEAEKSGKRTGQRYNKGLGGVIATGAKKLFAPVAVAAGGVVAIDFFKDAITGASDLAESTTKMANVFGTAAKDVEKFASGGAKALGMTTLQARDAATTFGVFGKAANLTGPALAKFSTDTTKLATDLASFHNTTPEDAIEAIGAALRGEAEPMRRYGVLLDDASMRQQALAMGLIKTTKQALNPQQKVLAAHAMIMAQTKDAANDFAETSDGLANKQRILSASFSDFRTKLGEMLLPMATWTTQLGIDAVDGIAKLTSGLGQGQDVMARFKGVLDAAAESPFGQWVQGLVSGLKDRLMPAFSGLSRMVTEDLIPSLVSMGAAIFNAVRAILNSPITGFILNILTPVVMGFVDGVINVIHGLVNFLSGVFKVIAGILTGDWSKAWEGVKQVVTGAVQVVVGVIQTGLIGRAMAVLRAFGGFVGKVVKPIGDWFSVTLVNALRTFGTWVANIGMSIASFLGGWLARIVGAVFTPLRGWFTNVIPAALRAMYGFFTNAWTGAQTIVSAVWNRLVIGPLTAARSWFASIIPTALRTMQSFFTRIFQAVLGFLAATWNQISTSVLTPIRNWFASIIPAALNVFRGAADRVFAFFGRIVSGAKRTAEIAFNGIIAGLKQLGVWAERIVTGIGRTFEKIKGAIEVPVKYVVNSIIRDKLASAWNAVAEKLNLPKWEFAGWRAGGWTGPGAADKPAGIVHADEFVIRKRSQRKLRRERPGLLDYMNRWGELPPGYAGGGLVYRSMAAWLKKNLPGIAITSSYRPGSITSSGNRSYHSMGMALDISPSMRAFNVIKATFGPSIAELIFTPAGARQIKNGRPHGGIYRGAVAAQHYNHVHWAMRSPVGDVPPGAAGDIGPDGGFTIANPIAEALKKLIGPLFNGARGLIDGLTGLFGNGDAAKMAGAFAKKPVDAVEKWLREKIDQVFPAMFADAAADALGDTGSTTGGVWGAVRDAASRYGWGAGANWSALQWIVNRESGGNPNAKNPRSTAYGLFQFLNCVTLDAQILTRRGWLDHDQVRPGDETIGYNPATGRNEWTTIRHVVHKPAQSIVVMRNDRWSARVTPGHRWWTARRGVALVDEPFSVCPECGATGGKRGVFRSDRSLRTHRAKLHGVEPRATQYVDYEGFTRTDELTTAHTLLLSAAADTGDGLPVTDDEALLLGWLAGDGTVRFPTPDAVHLKLWQAKPHRVAEIRELLARIGIPCTEYVRARGEGRLDEHSWYLLAAGAHDLAERSGLRGGFTAMVPRMSPSQRTAWLEGVAAAEGTAVPSGSDGEVMRIPQNDGDVADATVLAAYLSGFRPSVRRRPNQPGFGMITLARPEVHAAAVTVADAGVEDVWCVQTDLGTWTMRQDGQVSLTGNSTWASVGARKTSDPGGQAAAGMRYIKQRYGTPMNAQAFWRRNGWYQDGGRVLPASKIDHVEIMDSGGILRPGVSLVHNFTGRPETIRTWEQEQALRRGGTQIIINGIKHDSVEEFASELNFALLRASSRSRYSEVMT